MPNKAYHSTGLPRFRTLPGLRRGECWAVNLWRMLDFQNLSIQPLVQLFCKVEQSTHCIHQICNHLIFTMSSKPIHYLSSFCCHAESHHHNWIRATLATVICQVLSEHNASIQQIFGQDDFDIILMCLCFVFEMVVSLSSRGLSHQSKSENCWHWSIWLFKGRCAYCTLHAFPNGQKCKIFNNGGDWGPGGHCQLDVSRCRVLWGHRLGCSYCIAKNITYDIRWHSPVNERATQSNILLGVCSPGQIGSLQHYSTASCLRISMMLQCYKVWARSCWCNY